MPDTSTSLGHLQFMRSQAGRIEVLLVTLVVDVLGVGLALFLTLLTLDTEGVPALVGRLIACAVFGFTVIWSGYRLNRINAL
jgi:hypothetical protein